MKRRMFIAALAAGLLVTVPFRAQATLPVIDYTAILQAIMQTLKQVQQYAQQVAQYQLQLQQYENQIKNTIAPVTYIWQQATKTINDVMGAYQMLNGGSLQAYLSKFQSVDYYRNVSPGSYQPQWAGSVSQKQANDAMVQGILAQQDQLRRDAATLEQLQSNAQGSQGQMQALQAANQLAAQMAQQLMQIRALLLQEQQAVVARQQTLANEEAMRQAATEKYDNWNYQPAAKIGYQP